MDFIGYMIKTSDLLHEDFINFLTKESVYLLGFMWADGGFYPNTHRAKNNIRIEISSDDGNILLPVFEKTGKWNIFKRHRKGRKEQILFHASSKQLKEFLTNNNYLNRKSDNIIFRKIPINLKMYFLRGLIDGDGCFYKSLNEKINQFSLCSAYDQCWDSITEYLEENDIKYFIYRQIEKTENKHSKIRIFGKKNIKKLNELIYNDSYDGIGLKRKFDKCKMIIA